jgi:uncharacterized membrane protein
VKAVSKYGPCLLVGIPLVLIADRRAALVICFFYAASFLWTRADAYCEGWDEALAQPTYTTDAPRSAP